MDAPLERLREAYRDEAGVPGHDDTVDRLFEQYFEPGPSASSSPSSQPRTRRRAIDVVRTAWHRLRRG